MSRGAELTSNPETDKGGILAELERALAEEEKELIRRGEEEAKQQQENANARGN